MFVKWAPSLNGWNDKQWTLETLDISQAFWSTLRTQQAPHRMPMKWGCRGWREVFYGDFDAISSYVGHLWINYIFQNTVKCNSLYLPQIHASATVCSAVCSGVHKKKYHSSASLTLMREIHRWPMGSPQKRPVTQKLFPSDDVMQKSFVESVMVTVASLVSWEESSATGVLSFGFLCTIHPPFQDNIISYSHGTHIYWLFEITELWTLNNLSKNEL